MYRRIGPAFNMNLSYFISLLTTTPLFYFDKFIVVCYLLGHNLCYAIVNKMEKQSLSECWVVVMMFLIFGLKINFRWK